MKEMQGSSGALLAQQKKSLEAKVNYNIEQFMLLYNKNIRSEWLLTPLNEICAAIDKLDDLPDSLTKIAGFQDCIVAIILNKDFTVNVREKVLDIVQIAIKKMQTSDYEQSCSNFIKHVFLNVGLKNQEFIEELKKEKEIINKVDSCLKALKAEQERNLKISSLLKKVMEVINIDEKIENNVEENVENAKNHISMRYMDIIDLLQNNTMIAKNKMIVMQLLDVKFLRIANKQILQKTIDINRAVAFWMLNKLFEIYPIYTQDKKFVTALNNVFEADITQDPTCKFQNYIKQDAKNLKSRNEINSLLTKIIQQEDHKLEVEKLATEIVSLLVQLEGESMPNFVELFLNEYMKTECINQKKCAIAIELVIKLFDKGVFCKYSMDLLKDFYENNKDSAVLISPKIVNVIDRDNELQSEDKENQVPETNKSVQQKGEFKFPVPPSLGFIY